MINLVITEELLRDLLDRDGPPARIGITLKGGGWQVSDMLSASDAGRTAWTQAQLKRWLASDPAGPDLLVAAASVEGGYRLARDRGDCTPPGAGEQVGFVPNTYIGPSVARTVKAWSDAYWFDEALARELVHAGYTQDDVADSLWLTAGGRFHQVRKTPDGHVYLAGMTPDQAMSWCYRAAVSEGELAELPSALMHAVQVGAHTRSLLAAIAPVETAADQAIGAVEDLRLLTDLVKTRLLPDLREARSRMAAIVANTSTTQQEAARRLGMKKQTLSGLLKR